LSRNFVDHIRIWCQSGKGGAGSHHLRREKFIPKGGPDGGDGGRGGHIVLKGNRNLWTLLHLRYKRHIKAENGANGGKQESTGKQGADHFIEVPLGAVAYDHDTNEKLGEVTEHDEELIILKGGRGGLGNVHFKSATRQTPRFAQGGEEGEERNVLVELKLLADVGLVGFPNAGKSTLLSVLSAAKPEIADYPFTTLTPNLGIVAHRDFQSFVMADIPGIIEGASEGKGLGLRFLRHIERNSILLFLIPADASNIQKDYEVLLSELKKHNPELLLKERIIAISKSDLLDDELKGEISASLKIPHSYISSVAQKGLSELKDEIWKRLHETE
jgi:GTP-binding protein